MVDQARLRVTDDVLHLISVLEFLLVPSHNWFNDRKGIRLVKTVCQLSQKVLSELVKEENRIRRNWLTQIHLENGLQDSVVWVLKANWTTDKNVQC